MVKIPSKFHGLDPDPDPDDFYNLMEMSLSKDTSVVKKIHEDLISSFRVKLLTDKQISKQNQQRQKHNLLGGGNNNNNNNQSSNI